MYPTVGSLASPRSGLRRGASLLILICSYANFFLSPQTKAPHNARADPWIKTTERFKRLRAKTASPIFEILLSQ